MREDNSYLGVTKTYTYDLAGNILQKKEYTGAQHGEETLGTPAETIVYSYPSTGWKDQLVSYNGQGITYDQIGNPLSYWNGMEFTWGNGRQLTGIANGSHTVSYQYDSNSMRTKKTVDGVTTEYFLNGSTLLSQVTGDTQLDFFYDDLGNAMGFIKNGTDKYYYIRNLQNDVAGILDSSGTQVVEYVYDTWGKLKSITGAMAETIGRENPLRYRGYYYDEETGFYYLQSRYYDPETGRFLNADETVLTGQGITSGNMYAYCGNNPVMRTDPSGRLWQEFIKAVESALTVLTPALAGCGGVAALDGPFPFGDLIGGAGALLLMIGALAYGVYTAATQPAPAIPAPSIPKFNTESKTKDRTIAGTMPKDKKDQGKTYYHVTTPENAVKILTSKTLIGSAAEGNYVYAWERMPNKKAIKYSGAHPGVIISFKTTASFESDPGINNPYVMAYGPVRSVFPRPITVWDVNIVG